MNSKRNADIASERSRQSHAAYGTRGPSIQEQAAEAYLSKTPSGTPKKQSRPQSGNPYANKTPQHVSKKMYGEGIRDMDCRQFLSTDINDYLDKNKKANCVSFKDFLTDKKKVLQYKYQKNMHSDYS